MTADGNTSELRTSGDPQPMTHMGASRTWLPAETSLDFDKLTAVLRRRWWVILVAVIVVGGGAFAYSMTRTKKYTATAAVSFQQNPNTQTLAGLSYSGTQIMNPESNLEQVQYGDVAARTAAIVGHGLTPGEVRSMLTFSIAGTTSSFIDIAATAPSPELAADVANTYARIFVSEQQNSGQSYYAHALSIVSKQLARMTPRQRNTTVGLELEARYQSLGLLAELRSNTVQLAQVAPIPGSPSSPRVLKDTVIGVFVGLILGILLVFALERMDKAMHTPKEFEDGYGLPLLGTIPASSELARPVEASMSQIPAREAEAFQLVQAQLRYFNVDQRLTSMLVTSSTPGDGKTTLAVHLAAAAVRADSRVLLLEADLRRPSISHKLGLAADPGLSEVLIGGAALEDVIQSVAVESALGGDAGNAAKLDVVVAGSTTPPNPAALIDSHAMQAVLDYAKEHYDMLVVDSPPVTVVSDAFPLLTAVDGVIVVGRVSHDQRDMVANASETLRRVGAPTLGVVVNFVKRGNRSAYSYYYNS